MPAQYVALIVILAIFGAIALVAIFRFRKTRVSIKGPGTALEVEGETSPEQPQVVPETETPTARTSIGGRVSGSTVITSARGGEAEAKIEKDVKDSDILTEA